GNSIPVGTFAHVAEVSVPPASAAVLAVLTAGVKDPSPRVRLEAVRSLAGVKAARAASAALSAVAMPSDRVLDYAMWLTTRELEPVWLPAFVAGTHLLDGDVRKIAFAVRASGSPDLLPALNDVLAKRALTTEQRTDLLDLL